MKPKQMIDMGSLLDDIYPFTMKPEQLPDMGNLLEDICPFMIKHNNDTFWKYVNLSKPTDFICLTVNDIQELSKWWYDDKYTPNMSIPSDILVANTIPIRDCIIKLTIEEYIAQFRLVIFDSAKTDTANNIMYGAVICNPFKWDTLSGKCIGYMITKFGDENMVCLAADVAYNEYVTPRDMETIKADSLILPVLARYGLQAWYSIQLALLHPVVKDVFNHPTKERIFDSSSNKNKKQKTRYIKKHVIHIDEINDVLKDTSRDYNRHTMAWYVIGHKRKMKNGKDTFVKGHWRGPLREAKNAEIREREIIYEKKEK